MNRTELAQLLATATLAARAAGDLMRKNLNKPKKINTSSQRDIKLDLDVRCQKRIEQILASRGNARLPVVGEEGIQGDPSAEYRWVVDPIDGTVNFTYGIPHACVSIALQQRVRSGGAGAKSNEENYKSILGVVYEPFTDELWSRVQGQSSRLNGRRIACSERRHLREAIVSFGFAKDTATLNRMLPTVTQLFRRVRKVRMMGAAALAICYVASGRMDAFLEYGLRLWDIAAAGFILEGAGGHFWSEPLPGAYTYHVRATNARLRRVIQPYSP